MRYFVGQRKKKNFLPKNIIRVLIGIKKMRSAAGGDSFPLLPSAYDDPKAVALVLFYRDRDAHSSMLGQ